MSEGETPAGSNGHAQAGNLATVAIRVGQHQDVSDQHSEPLVLTASYTFDDAEDAAEKFAERRVGNVYIRYHNPTVAAFEERLAAMEGAEAALATGSGMATYLAVAMALLKAGDHVVLAGGMFGATSYMFEKYFQPFGVSMTLADVRDMDAWRRSIRPNTKLFIVETPTNPTLYVADLRQLADLAHEHGCMLVVDNTLCTP
ncbi:MAG: aminotransferase class I/II-fold pyridoxal phosphate-dependent enzyme, partial [Myxococcota bacterium]|nr:aminotransferase class I/II-fold pyridoxal phosphate-dependent enzyme [Myxococcota bacterium]